jgi:hypothetical protein
LGTDILAVGDLDLFLASGNRAALYQKSLLKLQTTVQ